MMQFLRTVWLRITKLFAMRATFLLARLCFGGFIFVTSFYALLFYIPYSRHMLFEWHVVGGLNVLAKYHSLLFWLAALPLCLNLLANLRELKVRRLTIGLVFALAIAGIAISLHPLLPNLPPDERSLIWSLIALYPLVWIAAIDWKAAGARDTPAKSAQVELSFGRTVVVALSVSCLYLAIFAIRYVSSGTANFTGPELLFFALCSITSHLFIFGLLFAGVGFINAVSRKFSQPAKLAIILQSALAALALMLILRKVVFAAVSFNNHLADLSAVALPLALVTYTSSSLLRFRSLDSASTNRRFSLAFARIYRAPAFRWISSTMCVAGVGLFAYSIPVNLQGVDWNGLLQKLSVLLVWAAAFAVLRAMRRPQSTKQVSFATLGLMLLSGVGIYTAIQFGRPMLNRVIRHRAPTVALLMDRYADYDPSFGVASEILAPATVDVLQGTPEDPFFELLRQNTNIPPEVKVSPVTVDLVNPLTRTETKKPNIFIFVIDSLRQDYLSAYDERVRFTPSLDRFARESVVMKNAFTRYGGTALAEPSIWTGGMQLHKQFEGPFYSLNSLQKLVDVEKYRCFITVDPILKSLLRPSADIVELDQDVNWKDYDFVRTLSELKNKIADSTDNQQPLFVYTQPQNVHLVSLKASQRLPPSSDKYDGFETQHAFEVERMDEAFGDFMRFLKSRGMYDDSIIILTADHGDSLGEDGHWGHGNSIYPEVIRIPLIVHLPAGLQRSVVWNTDSIAFSTDITPSLYYLLGHRPVANHDLLGRPLFTSTMQEHDAYLRESYLIVDSYGPVYGMLRDNGRSLFIADAGRNKEYVYDLTRGYGGKRVNVTDDTTNEYEALISRDIQRIDVFYHFHPAEQLATTQKQSSTIAQLYSLLFSR